MSNKRDNTINDKLDALSEYIDVYGSKAKSKPNQELSEEEIKRNDILKELPEAYKVMALQNGMSLSELRELYAQVKVEYAAKKFDYNRTARDVSNERRQDNVRERILDDKLEHVNEQTRGQRRRERERERYRT